ncbi:PREDICTED: RNA-binding protein 27-like, partial [Chlamydotis macqueenii]|uniref:RNA-binding protein 27-like n=1 Tax=Chlamydotis macqueenii TaxID=187382 RepID=UPI0005299110
IMGLFDTWSNPPESLSRLERSLRNPPSVVLSSSPSVPSCAAGTCVGDEGSWQRTLEVASGCRESRIQECKYKMFNQENYAPCACSNNVCDADPSALANYVVALVKKDKPEKELKAFCADQLDVFLQKETSGFVDKLFESLYTKSYLPSLEPVKVEAKPAGQEKEEVKEELSLKQNFQESVEEERDSRKKKYSSPQRSRTDSSEQRTREKKRDDGKWRDYDRYYDRSDLYREKSGWRRGRSKSRSKSRGLSRSRSRSRGRSKDRDTNRSV